VSPHEERDPGFAALIAEGLTPKQAWQEIRDMYVADPATRAVIDRMRQDKAGRAALAWSRMMWAGYGLAPPWEEPEQ
jgi:hypothetical protein